MTTMCCTKHRNSGLERNGNNFFSLSMNPRPTNALLPEKIQTIFLLIMKSSRPTVWLGILTSWIRAFYFFAENVKHKSAKFNFVQCVTKNKFCLPIGTGLLIQLEDPTIDSWACVRNWANITQPSSSAITLYSCFRTFRYHWRITNFQSFRMAVIIPLLQMLGFM